MHFPFMWDYEALFGLLGQMPCDRSSDKTVFRKEKLEKDQPEEKPAETSKASESVAEA